MKKKMGTIRDTEKIYCSIALGFAVIVGTLCFILMLKPIGKGLILGTLFSIINFVLMAETLPMRIGHTRKKGVGISFLLIFLRYALLAIPLALSIKLNQFNMAATVFGLFSVQLVIMTDHISRYIKMRTQKNQLY